MQISKREVLVPAGHEIAQHMQHLATTACGRELPTTLVTRSWSRVRCPDCLAVDPSPPGVER